LVKFNWYHIAGTEAYLAHKVERNVSCVHAHVIRVGVDLYALTYIIFDCRGPKTVLRYSTESGKPLGRLRETVEDVLREE
jgi:hypothetical protein